MHGKNFTTDRPQKLEANFRLSTWDLMFRGVIAQYVAVGLCQDAEPVQIGKADLCFTRL
jgi:hypothetical protein